MNILEIRICNQAAPLWLWFGFQMALIETGAEAEC